MQGPGNKAMSTLLSQSCYWYVVYMTPTGYIHIVQPTIKCNPSLSFSTWPSHRRMEFIRSIIFVWVDTITNIIHWSQQLYTKTCCKSYFQWPQSCDVFNSQWREMKTRNWSLQGTTKFQCDIMRRNYAQATCYPCPKNQLSSRTHNLDRIQLSTTKH